MIRWPAELTDECLERLFLACLTGGQVDALTREWFVRGALAMLRQGVTLDQALGLAGGGGRTLRHRLLRVRRDQHLADAVDAMAVDGQAGPWECSKRLAPLVRRFEANTWPRVRVLSAPPADWPQWKASLFRAAQTGQPLPASPEWIERTWKRVRGGPVPRAAGTVLAQYF